MVEAGGAELVGAATLAAFLGAFAGTRIMKQVTMATVQRIVGVMLILLAERRPTACGRRFCDLLVLLEARMLRDFFLGFVRIHILHHACEKPIYGTWIIEELARHGYRLSAGTLYPILHRLERQRYLSSYKDVINGKVRKYYRITPEGEASLEEAKKKIRELVQEVL